MNTENTIKFLWENIIAYYGLPEAVLTDHGSNFDNIEIKKMFSEINCKKIYSSPYNPQCNGASENKVKILKKILSHSCGKLTQVDWDEKIPLIMLSMNSSLNTVRKFSSFTIVHGFSGKSLADLQFILREKGLNFENVNFDKDVETLKGIITSRTNGQHNLLNNANLIIDQFQELLEIKKKILISELDLISNIIEEFEFNIINPSKKRAILPIVGQIGEVLFGLSSTGTVEKLSDKLE